MLQQLTGYVETEDARLFDYRQSFQHKLMYKVFLVLLTDLRHLEGANARTHVGARFLSPPTEFIPHGACASGFRQVTHLLRATSCHSTRFVDQESCDSLNCFEGLTF